MPPNAGELPCLPFTFDVSVPGVHEDRCDDKPATSEAIHSAMLALPASPGVIALEAGDGRTVTLATTADMRRWARSRLVPDPAEMNEPSRRADLRGLVHRVRAVAVGSAFEADWAYLQHARSRLPHAYRSVLDRWQRWFVHVDPAQQFPRFVKTASPALGKGVHLGPIADKHAAARYIELLEGMFDLCRYHHILVQAPAATACVYKEMGRCPAPCDGSVSMKQYRTMIAEAIAFATGSIDLWQTRWRSEMDEAIAALQFERAELLKRRLEDSHDATKRAFAQVRAIESFRFVSVQTSEAAGQLRLFVINGGWIAPMCDVPIDAGDEQWHRVAQSIERHFADRPVSLDRSESLENLAVVCRHLFTKPRTRSTGGKFVAVDQSVDPRELRGAARAVLKKLDEQAAMIEENEME